jgi:hypothetical protein
MEAFGEVDRVRKKSFFIKEMFLRNHLNSRLAASSTRLYVFVTQKSGHLFFFKKKRHGNVGNSCGMNRIAAKASRNVLTAKNPKGAILPPLPLFFFKKEKQICEREELRTKSGSRKGTQLFVLWVQETKCPKNPRKAEAASAVRNERGTNGGFQRRGG